jgi:hypothetical protein
MAGNHATGQALGALQREMSIRTTGEPIGIKDLVAALLDVQETIGKRVPMTPEEVSLGLRKVFESNIDYGTIDPAIGQHLDALYGYVRKQAWPTIHARVKDTPQARDLEPDTEPVALQERAEAERQRRADLPLRQAVAAGKKSDHVFRTAFVGAGAAIAYWIATLGANHEPGDAIIIGPPQPWAGTRGEGVVAHPEHMITPMLQYVDEQLPAADDAAGYDRWLERGVFSDLIERVLDVSGFQRVRVPVTRLRRDGGLYEISVDRDSYYARDVVVGAGTGPHRPPARVPAERIARVAGHIQGGGAGTDRRIMDMDVFTRVMNRLEIADGKLRVGEGRHQDNIRLILSGGNGGIDVAFEALRRGMKVHWVVGGTNPFFLPGFPNIGAYLAYVRAHAKTPGAPPLQPLASVDLEELYGVQSIKYFRRVLTELAGREFEGLYFSRLDHPKETADGVIAMLEGGTTAPPQGEAHVLVYAHGQDFSTFRLLDSFRGQLIAEPDVNRRFKAPGERPLPPKGEHVDPDDAQFQPHAALGVRSEDASLRVVGALAFRVLPRVAADRLARRVPDLTAALATSRGLMEDSLRRADAVCGAAKNVETASAEQRAADREEVSADDRRIVVALDAFRSACTEHDRWEAFLRTKAATEPRAAEELKLLTPFRRLLTTCRTESNTDMRPVIASQPRNVLVNDQLVPTRTQIEATRGFVPADVTERVNFLVADRSALMIYIGQRLRSAPSIAQEEIADEIISERLAAVPPKQAAFQKRWEERINALAKRTGASASTKAAL